MSRTTSIKLKGGNKKVNNQEDGLSNLPDEILIKVLSCLETREAVRSGILSTRRKFVWAFVPVLDLNQYDFKFKDQNTAYGGHKREEARFCNFMNQVLIARKLPCISKIRIRGGKCNPYRLQSWMRAALDRNANELDFEFEELSLDPPCELTKSLFIHNKLVILKLRVDMTLNYPAKSCVLPNLKALELDSIRYRDEHSLPNLLTSCPLLEDLTINIGEDYSGILNLISHSVKRLKKVHDEDGEWLSKIVFDAPAVESLDISFGVVNEVLVKDLSRVVDAKLNNITGYVSDIYKLLRGVSNAKFLKLDKFTVETIIRSDKYDFPLFYNLTRLEIYGRSLDYSFGGVPAKTLVSELLIEILKCTPRLEHLMYEVCQ